MIKNYFTSFLLTSLFLNLGLACSPLFAQRSVSCDVYLDASPITRTTGFGEENVVSGNYQAVAQQYNGVSGQIKSVLFWGRVNPAANVATNTLKVVVYQANLGLPGVILGQQNIVVDSSNVAAPFVATFGSPINVSGSIIISVEPLSASTNNYFIQRNVIPNGANGNLIKIKQSNQWFKDLVLTDASYDFDFMILPVKVVSVAASFTSSTSVNTVNFTNTSTGATTYFWDFGDSNTSNSASPSHPYTASATYNVKLVATSISSTGGMCSDSVTNTVNFTLTGINQHIKKNKISIVNSLVHDKLIIESKEDTELNIYNTLGSLIQTIDIKQNTIREISVENLKDGMYFISSSAIKPIKFIKN